MSYPIIPCDLCGSQDGLQRQVIKRMLDEWEAKAPGREGGGQKMFSALMNARPSHLLDPALFDFARLEPGTSADKFYRTEKQGVKPPSGLVS